MPGPNIALVSTGETIFPDHHNSLANLVNSGAGGPIALAAMPVMDSAHMSAANKTTTGTVVQRELNVCDPAFGADPTGVADSTAAIQLAIDTALGGGHPGIGNCPIKILYDATVTSGSPNVACPSGSFTSPGDVGVIVNLPGAGANGTQFLSTILSVTDGQHIVLAANTANGTGGTVTSGLTMVYGTRLATRTASASIFIPAGTYKTTGDLMIVSALGLSIRGTLRTRLMASGTAVKHTLYLNGVADCEIGPFVFTGDGTEALTEALSYQWTGYANDVGGGGTSSPNNLIARTSTRNFFHPLTVQSPICVRGIGIGTNSADLQVDQALFLHPIVYGGTANTTPGSQDATNWLEGIAIGSGTSGNVDIIDLVGAKSFFFTRGIVPNQAKGFSLIGGGTQDSGTDLLPSTQSYAVWQGFRSEGAGAMFGSRGGTSVSMNLAIRDGDWHGNQIVSGGKIGEFDNTGIVTLENVRFSNTGATIPYINLSPGTSSNNHRATLLLQAVTTPSSLTRFARGSARAAVVSLGYTQQDQSSQVTLAHDPGLTLLGGTLPVVQIDNTVAGCTGTGATAFPIVAGGVMTGLLPGNPGTGYASGGVAPTITIIANHGTGAAFTANLSGDGVGSYTQVTGGADYSGLTTSGPMLSGGNLSTSSTPSVIDVSLYRASAGVWGVTGNVVIGLDGHANRTLTVNSAILGASSVLSGNDLNFQRLGISTIRSSGLGGVLILESPNAAASSALPRIQLGNGDISATDVLNSSFGVKYSDTGTGTQPVVALFTHRPLSAQTPATNYGTTIRHAATSDTTQDRAQYDVASYWVTATDASRAARTVHSVYDTAAREVMRMESVGGAPAAGFLGAAAVVRQTLAAAATDPASTQTLVNTLRTALINLGLGA